MTHSTASPFVFLPWSRSFGVDPKKGAATIRKQLKIGKSKCNMLLMLLMLLMHKMHKIEMTHVWHWVR